jgi:hypothetical protein
MRVFIPRKSWVPIKAAIFHSYGRNDLPGLGRERKVHPDLVLMRVNHGPVNAATEPIRQNYRKYH